MSLKFIGKCVLNLHDGTELIEIVLNMIYHGKEISSFPPDSNSLYHHRHHHGVRPL
jgi:hypothetical protein